MFVDIIYFTTSPATFIMSKTLKTIDITYLCLTKLIITLDFENMPPKTIFSLISSNLCENLSKLGHLARRSEFGTSNDKITVSKFGGSVRVLFY